MMGALFGPGRAEERNSNVPAKASWRKDKFGSGLGLSSRQSGLRLYWDQHQALAELA